MEEEKNAAKEALDATAFAQLLFGPSGRQTRAFFLAFGIPGDHGNRSQNRVNPGNKAQTPIGSIQADHTRTDLIQMHSPHQEWLSKGSIMAVGRRKQKKEW
jgi:hypothetical protein